MDLSRWGRKELDMTEQLPLFRQNKQFDTQVSSPEERLGPTFLLNRHAQLLSCVQTL